MNPFILKRPIITEKTYKLAAGKVYTFEVDPKATKGQIREAVEQTFNVDVLAIQTAKKKGKTKRAGKRRIEVELGSQKRAMVRIKPDQSIEIFEIKNS